MLIEVCIIGGGQHDQRTEQRTRAFARGSVFYGAAEAFGAEVNIGQPAAASQSDFFACQLGQNHRSRGLRRDRPDLLFDRRQVSLCHQRPQYNEPGLDPDGRDRGGKSCDLHGRLRSVRAF